MAITLRKGSPDYVVILRRLQKGEAPRDIARTTCYTSAMIGAVKAHQTMRTKDLKAGLVKEVDPKDQKIRAKAVKMIRRGTSTEEIVRKLQIPMRVVSAIRAHLSRGHYKSKP